MSDLTMLCFFLYIRFPALCFPDICCDSTDHGPQVDDGDEGVSGSEATAKQPKKKRPPKKTVEQNLSNINSAESERKCEVQWQFRAKNSAAVCYNR